MLEKMLERKWMVAVFLLIVPTLLRLVDKMSESGLVTVWLIVASAFFAAEVTNAALAREKAPEKATP